jgi:hypothetical protein
MGDLRVVAEKSASRRDDDVGRRQGRPAKDESLVSQLAADRLRANGDAAGTIDHE